ENMSNPVFSGLELSPSFTWYQHDEEHHYKHYAGITLFNLNQPKLSNFNNEYKMPLRLAINAGSRVYIKNLTLLPRGMFQLQGNQSQIIGGTDVVYSLGNNQFGLGGYYRLGDAAIASFKYFSDFIDVGISYDFNTSNINNTSSSNGNSFEIFVDYKIKQEIKYKQFEILIELFDEDTKEPLVGNGNFKNLTTKAKGKLFENKAKHYATFNEKEKIQLIFSHPEYETKKLVVTGEEGDEVNQKIYMSKLIKLFDFELEIFDKETSNPLVVDITLINQNNGDKKLLGNDSKFTTQFELGEKYTLSLDAEGYDNKIVEIRYNKIGTLSKTVFVTPTKPTIETSNLILAIKDEITLESIPSTIMAINISDPVNHSSSLIALNDNPPPTFPLEVGQSYEILVTKEGYFNKTIKIDNQSKNDILQEILMTPVEIGKSIIIDDLHFKTGLTELDDDSYRLLDQLVDFMSHNSTLKVEIAGHTDSDGSEEFNQSLSEGRAQSAVNYIIEKGIDESRLVAKGYGESEPMVENDTEENKAKNRRVELKVIGK
ncbi:MAG: OmpA family protein, partial [Bacteroidota bacterium]|nr:OmpA family protein [Bacteroidota bacterium]